jgi:malic enzyme
MLHDEEDEALDALTDLRREQPLAPGETDRMVAVLRSEGWLRRRAATRWPLLAAAAVIAFAAGAFAGSAYTRRGSLEDALSGANVFVGLSGPRILSLDALRSMGRPRIVFALANPDPEIDPLDAAPEVDVLATGRSDYPNQVNNVLAFPGVFRGLLDARARGVSAEVELAAAGALAGTVRPEVRSAEYILPSVFDRDVVPAVARAVAAATRDAGLARKTIAEP